MELIVRLGDREEKVVVERQGERHLVTLGNRALTVDRRSAGRLWSLVVDGIAHEVSVAPEDGGYRVTGRRAAYRVAVTDPLTHLAQVSAGAARGGQGHEVVKAYMPGRVVTLLAEEGQEVAAGDGLVVLEAMKMENEIRAEHSGVVKKVFVEPGQTVEGGDPLFEIGPIV